MITEKEYLQAVSETNSDFTPFIDIAINERAFRDILIKHLIKNEAINIYYHSYMILNEVTKIVPSLFYCYWDKFVWLLKHENSYHRNYGMDLIANIIPVDKDNLFEPILDDYYKQLNDEKLVTIKHCIENSIAIIKAKPKLTTIIISKIIDSLRVNTNSEKHQNFLILKFLKLLSSIDNNFVDMKTVGEFLLIVLNDTKSDKIRKEIRIVTHNNLL
jgi:hypothetical protein